MYCRIDQEVFCGEGQPVGGTHEAGMSATQPAYATHNGDGPLDRARDLVLQHTQGFRLRAWEMGGECGCSAGTCGVNLHNGNLVLSWSLSGAGPADPPIRLYYNSIAGLDDSPVGRGWSHLYRQWVEEPGSGSGSGSGARAWLSQMVHPSGKSWALVRDADQRVERIISPDGRVTQFIYVGPYLSQIVDATGRTVSFDIDARTGLLLAVHDPTGATTRFRYDDCFQLAAWVNPGGEITRFEVDECFRLRSITTPLGETTRYAYAPGPPATVTITDARSHSIEVTLDADGNVSRARYPDAIVERYVWGANQRLKSATNGVGARTRLTYAAMDDLSVRLARIDLPIGALSFDWNSAEAALVRLEDENGNATKLDWRRLHPEHYPGFPTTLVDPQSQQWSFRWTGRGQLRQIIRGPLAFTFSLSHDRHYRRTRTVAPDGAVTEYRYNAWNHVNRMIDPTRESHVFTRDRNNRVLSRAAPDGRTTRFTWNGNGQLLETRTPSGAVWRTTWDADGRVLAKLDPTGAGITRTYDATANVVATVTRMGRRSRTVFDANHRPIESVDASGASTRYRYDDAHRLLSKTEPLNRQTTYAVDAMGRVTREVDPLGNATEYGWDDAGNRIRVEDAAGGITKIRHDELHRVVETTNPLGGVERVAYNALGQVERLTDAANGSTTYTWDAAGHMLAQTDGNGHTTKYTYNPLGLRTSVEDPAGNTATTSYDVNGRVAEVTDFLRRRTKYTWTADDQQETLTDPAGRVTTMAYDGAGRRTSVDSHGVESRTIWDADGRMDRVARWSGGRSGTFGKITKYTWDEMNRLLRVEGPGGVSVRYEYDAAGRRTAIFDAENQATRLSYNAGDLVISAETPRRGVTRYRHDRLGRPYWTVDANGGVTKRAYDALGRMSKETDATGAATSYTYDGVGRTLTKENALGATWTFRYDPVGNVVSGKSPEGNETRWTYDANDRPLTTRDPRGNVRSMAYDAGGQLLTTTDPSGTITNTYDILGRLQTQKNQAGEVTSYTWNDTWDKVETVTDARGATVEYDYDGEGNLANITAPYQGGRATTQFYYDDADRMTVKISPEGRRVDYAYDMCSRLESMTNGTGATIRYEYDADGNQTDIVTHLGNRTRFRYDLLGNLVEVVDAMGYRKSITYDKVGRRTSVTDAEGRREEEELDVLGRTRRKRDGLGNTTQYKYDDDDRLVELTDAGGSVTKFSYDGNGNQTGIVHTGRERVVQTFDGSNRLEKVEKFSSVTGARLATKELTLDPLGRELQRIEIDHTTGNRVRHAATYDDNGNVLTESTPDGDYTYVYDAANRKIREEQPDNTKFDNEHDGDGLLVRRVVNPGGHVINYAYDDAGRMTSLTMPGGRVTRRHYDHDGRLVREDQPAGPNGLSIHYRYTYNANGWMTRKQEVGLGGAVLETIAYSYDRTGKKLTETGSLLRYAYDGAGRLSSEIRVPSRPDWCDMDLTDWDALDATTWEELLLCDPAYSTSAQLDAMGNMLVEVVDGEVVTSTFQHNRIVSRTVAGLTHNFDYDDHGRRIRHDDGQGNITTLTWHPDGTLASVDVPRRGRVEYTYDSGNLLRERSTAAGRERMVWAGNALVAEGDGAGLTRLHHAGPEGFGSREATTYLDTGETHVAAYTDAGSVRRVYRDNDVVQEIHSRAYGDLVSVQSEPAARDSDPKATVHARFGVTRDQLTGFLYMRQRWYDPFTRQFLSPDPKGIEGARDKNPYRFAGGDPVNNADPAGEDFIDTYDSGVVYWQVETADFWERNTDTHTLGRKRGDRLYLWAHFRGGYLPYDLVETAAENIHRNGYDLDIAPRHLQQRQIGWILDRLRRGDVISKETGSETILEAAWSGLEAGALNLADTFTFNQIDSLHAANAAKWKEIGLEGTWVHTFSTVSATIAREALIAVVTAGAGQALSAARAGGQAAVGATRSAGYFARGTQALGAAVSGASTGARAARGALTAVNWAGRGYEAVTTVIDIRDGVKQVRDGNPWGYLTLGLAGINAAGAVAGGYGAIRRGLGKAATSTRIGRQARGLLRRLKGCGCFAADTLVHTPTGLRPIDAVEVGRLVRTVSRSERRTLDLETQPLPAQPWVQLHLTVEDSADPVELVLLRPTSWADENGASEGARIPILLDELGVGGLATVHRRANVPPPAAGGDGEQPVTGIARRPGAALVSVRLDGQDEPIRVTPGHRVWRADEQRWVPVAELSVGCIVQGVDGPTRVSAIAEAEPADVVNLEVAGDHVLRVGRIGWLVHNTSGYGERQIVTPYGADTTSAMAGEQWRRVVEAYPDDYRSANALRNAVVFVFEGPGGELFTSQQVSWIYGRRHSELLAIEEATRKFGAGKFKILGAYSEYQPCKKCRRVLQQIGAFVDYHWKYRNLSKTDRLFVAGQKSDTILEFLRNTGGACHL